MKNYTQMEIFQDRDLINVLLLSLFLTVIFIFKAPNTMLLLTVFSLHVEYSV